MGVQIRDFFYVHHKRGDHDVMYEISDSYDQGLTGFAGGYEYYGYLNNNGGWIIQRRTIATGAYRYIIGESDYATSWGIRGNLSYDTYDKLFIKG